MTMSSPGMGAATDGGLGDEALHSEEQTTTEIDQLHRLLKDHQGVTLLDKVATLLDKVSALSNTKNTARKLLSGFSPDVLSQALKVVDHPEREFEVFISSTLIKAYDRIIDEADGLSKGEAHEASVATENEIVTRTPPAQLQTQDPFLQSIISGAYQAQVRARENEARRTHQAEQEVKTVPERSNSNIGSRLKYTPKYSTWCQVEIAATAQPDSHHPCSRTKCPFFHNDQNEYTHSGLYEQEKNAGLVQDWSQLQPYVNHTGNNQRREKAGKKERYFDNMLRKFKNKNVATETKANAEHARKKREATLEAKATAVTTHKKRKAGRTLAPKERADKVAKKSKRDKAER